MATITDAWEFEKLIGRIKDEKAKGLVGIINESNDGNYITYQREIDGEKRILSIKHTEKEKTPFETFPLSEYLDRILRKGEQHGKLQLYNQQDLAEQGR